jgi:hypothetical protein
VAGLGSIFTFATGRRNNSVLVLPAGHEAISPVETA